MMKPDTFDNIPNILDPSQKDSIVFAGDISHLWNYLSFSQSETFDAHFSLAGLAGALGITEAELDEICRNKTAPEQ